MRSKGNHFPFYGQIYSKLTFHTFHLSPFKYRKLMGKEGKANIATKF